MSTTSVGQSVASESVTSDLLSRIASKTAKIGVIGQGYVGLPLARAFAEAGFPAIGFDIDPKKVDALNRGETYIKHIGAERVRGPIARGRFKATADFVAPRATATPSSSACRRRSASTASPTCRSSRTPRDGDRQAPAPRPARRPRVDDLSRHDRRGGASRSSRRRGCKLRRRLLPRVLARARGPGQRELPHADRSPRSSAACDAASATPGGALYARRRRHGRAGLVAREVAEAAKLLENVYRSHQHRARQRAEDGLRPDGHRRVGGHRGGEDQAVRLHAVLPGAGPRRPLHPDRPVLPVVEGARVRHRTRFIELAGEINTAMPHYVVEQGRRRR